MIVLGGSWQDLWLTWANRVRVWLEPWAAVGVHGYPPSGTEVVLVQVLLLELLGLALLTVLWSFLPRTRSPHTGWSRAWRAALLGAGLVLAGLQVQEFALRAYLATLPPAPFVPDPFYLYVGNPNQTITFTYPLPIRFNSVGLRERELPFAKPPGEFRILVTGDSNAFGQGVEADQVWPRVLEGLLRARYPARRITVINQAMPGYSLAQSWYLYQEVGRRYDPDLILVGCHGWTVRPETRDSRRFLVEVAPLRRLHRALYRSQTYLAVRKEVVRWHAHRTGWVPPEFCDPVQDLRLCIPDLFRFLEEVQSRRLAAVFVAPGPPDGRPAPRPVADQGAARRRPGRRTRPADPLRRMVPGPAAGAVHPECHRSALQRGRPRQHRPAFRRANREGAPAREDRQVGDPRRATQDIPPDGGRIPAGGVGLRRWPTALPSWPIPPRSPATVHPKRFVLHLTLLTAILLAGPARATSGPRPQALGPWTAVVLQEGLVQLELGPEPGAPIPLSPYVVSQDFPGRYPGAEVRRPGQESLVTSELAIRAHGPTLEVLAHGRRVLTLESTDQGYRLSAPATRHLLGLGEQFPPDREEATSTDLGRVTHPDWMGRQRRFWRRGPQAHPFGNTLSRFLGGNVGNASFPVLYGVGSPCWMLFLDDPARQEWDFRSGSAGPWSVRTDSPTRRLFLAVGPDLAALRRQWMGLVGRPPVPPRAAFGLWVSEYGFEDWGEIQDCLAGLRRQHFPVDGFVLDLQWFGGVQEDSPDSRMGSLRWDETNFPNPADHLRRLSEQEGLGLILIEEPYISQGLPEYEVLARRGFLGRQAPDDPTPCPITDSNWWGVGGILDPTHAEGRAFWHAWRRQPLVDMGVAGHWIDLGEPECYRHMQADGQFSTPFYQAGPHARVHNLYAHHWARGIWEGYAHHGVERRPFLLSRSGAPGIQRFGVAMWSGDIATTEESLAEHFNAQVHLGLSGIDYFGSDVGGFFREEFAGTPEELDWLYTRWFAAACAVDVPIRPHAFNLENRHRTSPDRIGHLDSNRENLRWRYRLLPYYYSLAHRAARLGDPLVAPPGLWFPQWDSGAALTGNLKMVGPDLLVALCADLRARELAVELPPQDWIDLRTGQRHRGSAALPLLREGRFELPLLARAGSILPMAVVDPATRNTSGRHDGQQAEDLVLRVHSGPQAGSFELIEDDGWTVAYRTGELTRTTVHRQTLEREEVVTLDPRQGSWPGAPDRRSVVVELVPPPHTRVTGVTLNGRALTCTRQGRFVRTRGALLDPQNQAVFRFRLTGAGSSSSAGNRGTRWEYCPGKGLRRR